LGRLRWISLAVMAVATILSLLAVTLPPERAQDFNTASHRGVGLRALETDWARADAAAAVALIDPAAGTGPADAFNAAMGDVHRGILSAVSSGWAAFDDLVALSQTAMSYQDLVDQALRVRATDPAAGLDQGAQAHQVAGAALDVQLAALIEQSDRAGAGARPGFTTAAAVSSWVCVALLLLIQVVMSRRTHRLINLGLIGAMAALIALTFQSSLSSQRVWNQLDQASVAVQSVRLIHQVETAAWTVAAADCGAIGQPAAFSAQHDEAGRRLGQAKVWLAELADSAVGLQPAWPALMAAWDEIQAAHDRLEPQTDPAQAAEIFGLNASSPWLDLVEASAQLEAELVWQVADGGLESALEQASLTLLLGLVGVSLALIGFRTRLTEYR
jgi:hypothetical protein